MNIYFWKLITKSSNTSEPADSGKQVRNPDRTPLKNKIQGYGGLLLL